ncbi:unnamed protein product, partial [Candidula unifasciata]
NCVIDGKVYRDGEATGDPCNRCWCYRGREVCEQRASNCVINGTVYLDGERTPDPCNRCWCTKGRNICERRACIVGM